MSDLPEKITVQEQAQAAGMGKIPVGAYPDIDALRDQIDHMLQAERPQNSHALIMAKVKATELDFWLRTHRGKHA